ncbi:MAG: TetR/AcrR family transcriptional regulator [Deltaproteobacteria bacterium]|nr:TetR/AcrR family transcriptional regulator [Deltaproteobacteria bacterium]
MAKTPRKDAPPPPAAGSLRLDLARSEIARASIALFARRGVEAVRVEDLLEAAGVARRTFYKHFRSKDDVLAAVYELVSRELLAALETGHKDGVDATAALRGTLDIYLGFHVDNYRILRVLVEEGLRSSSPLHPLRRRFREALVRALEDACLATTGRSLDPFVFVGLLSAIDGLSMELLVGPPAPADVARARAVLHGLLDAVLRAPELFPTRA